MKNDCQHSVIAEDWAVSSLSSFTQLIPISHSLWALTCFLICATQNQLIRSWLVVKNLKRFSVTIPLLFPESVR
ncbi:hypothetical protein QR98_0073530 [Sarcoptes scabiei]|uniref:Uncharacterized protein n=1 Tax=Sarcoptes scabiei TaxID=52283 RepID=A0A132ACX9_SARSC|nr:hypothetical protein QR98_0073530 [Sarcoptes scabiei]